MFNINNFNSGSRYSGNGNNNLNSSRRAPIEDDNRAPLARPEIEIDDTISATGRRYSSVSRQPETREIVQTPVVQEAPQKTTAEDLMDMKTYNDLLVYNANVQVKQPAVASTEAEVVAKPESNNKDAIIPEAITVSENPTPTTLKDATISDAAKVCRKPAPKEAEDSMSNSAVNKNEEVLKNSGKENSNPFLFTSATVETPAVTQAEIPAEVPLVDIPNETVELPQPIIEEKQTPIPTEAPVIIVADNPFVAPEPVLETPTTKSNTKTTNTTETYVHTGENIYDTITTDKGTYNIQLYLQKDGSYKTYVDNKPFDGITSDGQTVKRKSGDWDIDIHDSSLATQLKDFIGTSKADPLDVTTLTNTKLPTVPNLIDIKTESDSDIAKSILPVLDDDTTKAIPTAPELADIKTESDSDILASIVPVADDDKTDVRVGTIAEGYVPFANGTVSVKGTVGYDDQGMQTLTAEYNGKTFTVRTGVYDPSQEQKIVIPNRRDDDNVEADVTENDPIADTDTETDKNSSDNSDATNTKSGSEANQSNNSTPLDSSDLSMLNNKSAWDGTNTGHVDDGGVGTVSSLPYEFLGWEPEDSTSGNGRGSIDYASTREQGNFD